MSRPAESCHAVNLTFSLSEGIDRGVTCVKEPWIETSRGANKDARFRQVTSRAKPSLQYKCVFIADKNTEIIK